MNAGEEGEINGFYQLFTMKFFRVMSVLFTVIHQTLLSSVVVTGHRWLQSPCNVAGANWQVVQLYNTLDFKECENGNVQYYFYFFLYGLHVEVIVWLCL